MFGFDEEKIVEAAYKMQEAYQQEPDLFQAVTRVKKDCPTVDEPDLFLMWKAIDAYVDLNT